METVSFPRPSSPHTHNTSETYLTYKKVESQEPRVGVREAPVSGPCRSGFRLKAPLAPGYLAPLGLRAHMRRGWPVLEIIVCGPRKERGHGGSEAGIGSLSTML